MSPLPDPYADRVYRSLHAAPDLGYFRVSLRETDLHIGARGPLRQEATEAMGRFRRQVEEEIARRPRFKSALEPLRSRGDETPLIAAMLEAGRLAGVGPMAAVAGAIAEAVGRSLLPRSSELIVENGGDIFLSGSRERLVAVQAGSSPLSGLLAIAVKPCGGLGVCTSSGTVGHSLSLGKADAAMVLSPNCALADAAATRLGNLVAEANSLEPALDAICVIPGILGALVIQGDHLAVKGDIQLRFTKS